ncbi:alpha-(1,3)-fucosyltransferase 7 isoform X2 [Anoplolepis gracilipes]|uniref:alpha-(1,3)-fucosyltransferase 7 isoform X2 n=1 Tax=Anoplolepis gracilipes TaxID=354296 RepID=UPI003B9E1314
MNDSIMRKFPRFITRLLSVLFICKIFCVLLLFSSFLVVDRKYSVFWKQISVRQKDEEDGTYAPRESNVSKMMSFDKYLLEIGFTDEQIGNMSLLGKWLLAPEETPPPRSNTDRSYLILIWKHGPFLERRHIRHFTKNKFSPWDQCSTGNCTLTYDEKDLHRADAVVFHLHLIKRPSELPVRSRVNQRWIFLTDESPFHTFLHGSQRLSDYNGLFNWSMSYRMDSDVPIPYGRTVRIPDDVSNDKVRHWDAVLRTTKTKLVAVMGSNCDSHNGRWSYVKMLKSLLGDDLDIFGRCLDGNRTICPGHFKRDCTALNAYKFYLSFENSNCREYLTEKVFWNAYNKFAVPIIMGASRYDCQRLLPPHSFLHVDDFTGVDALANYLRKILFLRQNFDEKHFPGNRDSRRGGDRPGLKMKRGCGATR